jgi:uncharacterized membrane protein YeaQ/YmgE (transglycosylase-associated protein family)
MYMPNAGRLVQGTGFGIVGDLIIGVPGAFIGSRYSPGLESILVPVLSRQSRAPPSPR